MKKITTQTTKGLTRFCSVFCLSALVFLSLFAACERPELELEPEPPTPPVVDTDTLPANKFVGTWVLCAVNDVNSEPPATCDLADATTDTLVFTDDNRLIIRREANTSELYYQFTDNFLIRFKLDADLFPFNIIANRYYFRNEDQEMVLRGIITPFGYYKNLCFHRITLK